MPTKPSVKKPKDPPIAKAGESLSDRAIAKLRKDFPQVFGRDFYNDKKSWIVQPKPKSATQQGQWMCADCGVRFPNNIAVWGHSATHRRVWWTGENFEEA